MVDINNPKYGTITKIPPYRIAGQSPHTPSPAHKAYNFPRRSMFTLRLCLNISPFIRYYESYLTIALLLQLFLGLVRILEEIEALLLSQEEHLRNIRLMNNQLFKLALPWVLGYLNKIRIIDLDTMDLQTERLKISQEETSQRHIQVIAI